MELININRFHPLLVHLPIGILLLTAFLQWYQWRKKSDAFFEAIQLSLLVSFGFSCLAIFTGWRLAQEGGYDADLVWWHKWLGIAMTLASLLLYWLRAKRSKFAPVLFIIVLLLLTATGHNGGNLTHGSDYLFSKPDDRSLKVNDIKSANAFEAVILPIFQDKCIGCHNPSKLKGELLMSTKEGLLAGGENGAIFDLEHAEKSELLVRVNLPLSEKLHMPPKGKKQMLPDEIKLLQWWIQNKACFDCRVEEMEGSEELMGVLKKYETTEADPSVVKLDQLSDEKIAALRADGIGVARVAANSPFVNISLSRKPTIAKQMVKQLKNIAEHIQELDLSASGFQDDHAWVFKKMTHLQTLRLQKTKMTSAGFKHLRNLKYLKSINVYDTSIDDGVVDYIKQLPSLKRIYLWETKMTEKGMSELAVELPLLDVQSGTAKNIFKSPQLKSPQVTVSQNYFKDTTSIVLKSESPDTKIHYTLDGSVPDTNSTVYTSRINLKESTQLKYLAVKEYWQDSPMDSIQVIRSGVAIQTAKLSSAPNKNYPGKGANSLYDLERGSTNFRDGAWLGYQGTHFTASLELAEKQTISKVYLSSIAAQPSWIFHPRGCKVWTSTDGQNFELTREINFGELERMDETVQNVFEIPIPAQSTQFINIEILSQLKNPEWHGTPGGDSWVFIDEILIE